MSGTADNILDVVQTSDKAEAETSSQCESVEQVLQISNTDALDIRTLELRLSAPLVGIHRNLPQQTRSLHSLIVASDVLLHQSYLYYFNNLEVVIEACSAFEEGNFQQYFHYCGEAFVHESLLENARSCYEKSIALNPGGSKWSQHCMSTTLFWLGDLETSFLHGLAAIHLDPTIDLFYLQLAKNLIASGNEHKHVTSCLLRLGMELAADRSEIESFLAEKLGESLEKSDFFRAGSLTADLEGLIEIFEHEALVPWYSKAYIQSIKRPGAVKDSPWSRYGQSLRNVFSVDFYDSQNGQTKKDSLVDYLTSGYQAGLAPHPLFDAEYYDLHSKHTRDKRISPLMDYILSDGWNRPDTHIAFSSRVLQEAGLTSKNGMTPLENYLTHNRFSVSPCYWFDPAFYAEQKLELQEPPELETIDSQDHLSHYLMYGWKQGLKPHRLLDTKHILAQVGETTEPLTAYLNSRIDKQAITPVSCIDQDRLRQYSQSIHVSTSRCIQRLIYNGDNTQTPALVPFFDQSYYQKEHSHIGAMCPRRHFLEYGLSQDTAPNLFFSHSYIRKRHAQYSFSDRGAVETYFQHQQYKNPCLAIAISNCNSTDSNTELLSMLRHHVSNTDVDVYILARHGGNLYREFTENAHVHVFNGTASAKTASYQFDEGLEFLQSNGVKQILFYSVDLLDWFSSCREKNIQIKCRLPVRLSDSDLMRIETQLSKYDEVIFDSAQSLNHYTRVAPGLQCNKSVIMRGFQKPGASIFHHRNSSISSDVQDLLVVGRGHTQQQLDVFQHIAAHHQKSTIDKKLVAFYWIDERGPKESKQGPALCVRAELFNLTVVTDEDIPIFEVLDAADIYITSDEDARDSIRIVEAMAYGCAIYGFSDTSLCRELCGDNHVAVGAGDYSGMCLALVQAFDENSDISNKKAISENIALHNHSIAAYTSAILRNLKIAFTDLSEIQRISRENAIYLLSPDWGVSGVNTFAVNLVRQLNASGHNAKILFTRGRHGSYPEGKFMPDVPHLFLQPAGSNDWAGDIWRTLLEFLRPHESAVLLPNYDYIASAISPILPDHIGVIGISHSDDSEHYEHVYRLGRWWNHIVGVSERINDEICRLNQSYTDKTSTIRYGVPLESRITAEELCAKYDVNTGPIKLIYSGRMIRHQKRIERYIELINALDSMQVNYEFSLLGDGPQLDMLRTRLADNPRVFIPGRVDRESIEIALKESHIFVLLSDFEGLPLSLLEAMAQGVIPVVSDIDSGVHEILENEVNSFIFPKENIKAFARQISILSCDQKLTKTIAISAYETMRRKKLSDLDMCGQYNRIISEAFKEIANGEYSRPRSLSPRISTSGVIPPPWLNIGSSNGNSSIHSR